MTSLYKERHAEIIDTAIKLFRKKNYHGTSMQDIAEAVGIYRGSIYHYIDSKEEILYLIVERMVLEGIELFKKIQKEELPPIQKLRRAMHFHINYCVEHQDELNILLEDSKHLSEGYQKQIRETQKNYGNIFLDIIKEGILRGDFKESNPQMITFAIVGMTSWIYRWFDVNGKISADEVAEIFLDIILNGLLIK